MVTQTCLNVTLHIHYLSCYGETTLFPCTAFRLEEYSLFTTLCCLLSIVVHFQLLSVSNTAWTLLAAVKRGPLKVDYN